MADDALTKTCSLLEEMYGELGKGAAARLREWLSGVVPYAYPEILEKHLEERHVPLLLDAFWQVLPFGTGGRRGRVGYGANRLNPATVAMTVQGHCEYLRRAFPGRHEMAVVVANDVRVFRDISGAYQFLGGAHPLLGVSSRSLGRLACEVYAGNGIVSYFAEPRADHAVLSTPELSFLIGELGAVGGINLSASHNPPDDNGVKVYDEYGSQPVAPHDQRLIDAMEQARDVRAFSFQEALERGMIREVPRSLHQKYIDAYIRLYGDVHRPQPEALVVYTPLCGCGLTTVGEVLERLRFPVATPPDQGPDGAFAVIPFKAPNPEVPQATEPARKFAQQKGSGIVLSSDPDADRVGVEVRLADGSWYHLDGNQIAALLCYYLMLDPAGPRRRGLVIETLVTTKILAKIVERAGDSWLIDDLLVGFKYVADVLKTLEREGRWKSVACSPQQLVVAVEESHGVVMIPTIRDKDSVPACMYLAALYQKLRREGRTLLDYYIQILEELGAYDNVARSIMMRGAEGMLKKDGIMESLRASPPKTLGGQAVRKVVDYWDQESFGPFVSESDKLPRNVLQIFTDAFIITVRPSGTEPKLKFYCQLLPSGEPSTARGMELLRQARETAHRAARLVYNDLLARIGLSLGDAGLLLPDIVDLDLMQQFERETVPRLEEKLFRGGFHSLEELLAWLRAEAATMTPGADPLPALKAPLAYLCGQWSKQSAGTGLLDQLGGWANS
jgi:phosphoglucomutase/phosphomannomutase